MKCNIFEHFHPYTCSKRNILYASTMIFIFRLVVRPVIIKASMLILKIQFSDVFVTTGLKQHIVTKSFLPLKIYTQIMEMASVGTQVSQIYEIIYNLDSKT